ncbi:MAG TPA: hypothetical protein VGD58_01660 [Herpetosiphonaceae bacterium]
MDSLRPSRVTNFLRRRLTGRSIFMLLFGVLIAIASLIMPAEHAKAWEPWVFVNHPYPFAGCVHADYHSYTEGYSGVYQTIQPADTSLACGQSTGGQVVHIDMFGLPPGSVVRFDSYVNNRAICNGPSGNRHVVDIWVTPPGRSERYLGYMVYTHTFNDRNGSWSIADSDYDGRVVDWVAYVWPGNGSPVYVNGTLCWTGPHIHTVASRDLSYEQAYGSSTTTAQSVHVYPWAGMVDEHHELFQFGVNWDVVHY